MSATASGAEKAGGGTERRYTVEQKAAVIRVRRCDPTAFYDILELETIRATATDSDIKKAYRRLSLLTHPDKNGYENADEAFKMVSRAFGVLGDKEKREKYDRFGTDPDSRFANAQAQNPFSGFARRQASGAAGRGGGMGGGWEQEMTPEEMFQRFFGGGGFGGPFGAFDTGPQFVFNLGGGPGIRVHQFGGGRPRGRPRAANDQNDGGGSTMQTLLGLLPILFFFIIPLLSSIFSGDSSVPAGPRMVYDQPMPPYTEKRQTPNFKVDYFVNPVDVSGYTKNKFSQLDKTAESNLLRVLRSECDGEMRMKQRMVDDAQGWFFPDPEKMKRANEAEMPACRRLEKLGVRR